MATSAVKFQTTTFEQYDTASTNVTAIGEVIGIDGPSGQATIIDATHSGSSAREKVMGLPDEGRLTLTCNLVPGDTGQTALRTNRNAQTADPYKLTLADAGATELTFLAYVLGFSISGSTDGKWDARIDLEITDAVTWT